MADTVVRTAAQADFTLQIGELTTEDLRVVAFTGEEGISQLYSFRVDVASDLATIEFDSVLGKYAVLEIAGTSGLRYVHGIVCRFERTGQGRRQTFYTAEIVPVYWLLTKRFASRIFQQNNCSDMTVPGVVKKIFELAGIPQDACRLALSATYTAREYVVQYRETDWDFVSRLLEEEGIFTFFEHTLDGHKLVLADSPVAHVASATDAECPYREPTGLVPARDSIVSLRDTAEIQVGATRLADFDFAKSKTKLGATSAGESFKGLEYSDYPGGYLEKEIGTTLARVRLEEQQCRRRVVQMMGSVRGLMPGFKFTLAEHPISTLNVEYLVTHQSVFARQPQSAGAEGAGEDPTFETVIRAIPASVPFRPPRITRKPRVEGTQTAIVVGPSGEEIYTDKFGRVKVQFHWDLEGQYNENSSCWIRVSQAMAGGQYGFLFLPRVGQEVVVDFLEGDPDRPLIVGRVYNNEQMPAYTLPDHKTRSYIKTNSSAGGGGTNEILFEDKKDEEKILVYAQKDYHLRVKNDRVETVEKNQHLLVTEQYYEKIKQKKHVDVVTDLNEKIGGKHSHEITGDYGIKVGGNHSNETTGKLYLKSTQEVIIEGTAGLTLKVGGNFIKLDPSGVSIQGVLTKINSGGAAGAGTPVSLVAPEAAIEADTATPGADTTYSPETATPEALELTAAQFRKPEVPPAEEVITSWVEIEMVDEEGRPWRGEYYEITRPDGKVIKGYLNEQGQAHVFLPRNEQVQVSFPRLDARAWEKI